MVEDSKIIDGTISAVIYKRATGEIVRFIQCPVEMLVYYINKGEDYIEHDVIVSGEREYVDLYTLQVVSKQYPDYTLDDNNVLHGVPSGAKVRIEGVDYIADDQPIELSFEYKGEYKVFVYSFPYLDWSVTVIEN